ncbi:MAG: TAT-variant-translocated molybdopterin oxidoreductase [Saprospiraceae bacterium]
MKEQNNTIWTGTADITNDSAVQQAAKEEFVSLPVVEQLSNEGNLNIEASRRDFLKYLGFSIGAATVAASCDIPVKKALPYVVKPDTIVPGVATYYASSFVQGGDYCAILVKTRDGRPIKIEGNSFSKVTKGGTSARTQASVLGLYDTSRVDGPYRVAEANFDQPVAKRTSPGWEVIDAEIKGKLSANARIRIVANTIMSPTTKQAIADFTAKFPNTKLVTYDPISSSAILEANEQSFGQKVIPSYHFDKADVIVSFEADFLGTWISPIEYAGQYAQNRKIKDIANPKMSRHIQVESYMSLTGSNADNRILVKPSQQGAAIVALHNEVARGTGNIAVNPVTGADSKVTDKMKKVAEELLAHRGASLVVSGSNNLGEQVLINAINSYLGNYGHTLDFSEASLQRQGIDADIQNLVKEMNGGQVDALFVMDGANPAFEIPNADQFAAGAAKVGLKVSFAGVPNETSKLCDYIAPTHHFLESWGDAEPKVGHYSLIQPTIAPLFASIGRPGTRQAEESLLRWSDSASLDTSAEQPYYEYLKANWEQQLFTKQNQFATFQVFWDSALHDGIFQAPHEEEAGEDLVFAGKIKEAGATVRKPANSELEISFFETVNVGAGQYASNPWLMEMPDPVTRCVWGNYLAVPVKWDGGNEFNSFKNLNESEFYSEADQVDVTSNGTTERCTVIRQFGQMEGTLALAIGYGRTMTGMMGRALGDQIGVDVYPWLTLDANGNTQYYATDVTVSDKMSKDKEFACVQYHHTMGVTARGDNGEVVKDESTGKPLNVDEKASMTLGSGFQGGITDRSIIYKTNVKEIGELAEKIKVNREKAEELNSHSLYPYEEYKEKFYSQGHHWAMHVDLNACIGCGACQVACVAENNVPVVGKREVHRHHEMTWLRIDRYYYGDYENPNVVYQPMMCQHCDNAPCENVCPVAATNHSAEGLNQMTYNRCIGTRYCANNCPYKVRRFNWLDYTTADLFSSNEPTVSGESLPYGADNLTRMVLNPDVTVRSRGVIEKCSFCVQRIQEGKLTAKREGRRLVDADVKTACQTACPTGAIVFGDDNNSKGELHEKMAHPLNYKVLEEIDTRPSVDYAARVNNRSETLDV